MTTRQIASGVLAAFLLALLVWSFVAAVGDWGTRVMLGVGAGLGAIYTALGRLPEWILDFSGGLVTDEKDSANISPRVYLPILLAVMLVAVVSLVIGLRLL